nr:sulfotransferase domain-containing protein [Paludifilum halophilum]
MNRSKAICILGMHRSGTSVMSRAVNLLGADLGNRSKLLPPGKANPKGFWEHTGMIRCNHRILRTFSRSWDTVEPLPDRWWKSPRVQPLREELRNLVERDFSGKRLWAWKDPRTCLVLPLWQSILSELDTELCHVIVVRNPLDVAASLKERNGFPMKKSLNLWAHYTLSSLFWTIGTKRVVVHYDRLLRDWEPQLKKVASVLDIPWPKTEGKLKKGMNSFLDPNLQHSQSSLKQLKAEKVSQPIQKIYRLSLQAARNEDMLRKKKFNEQVKHLYHGFRMTAKPSHQHSLTVARQRAIR